MTPLARQIAAEPSDGVAAIAVTVAPAADGAAPSLALTTTPRPRNTTRSPLVALAALRRSARAMLISNAVREVKDRLEHIDANLLRGAPPGPLLAERARYGMLLAPFHEMVGRPGHLRTSCT